VKREPEEGTLEFEYREALQKLRCGTLGQVSWWCDCSFCTFKRGVLREELRKPPPDPDLLLVVLRRSLARRPWQGKQPGRRQPMAEVTGHLDWWANVSWICDICKEERPDRKISVQSHDISHTMGMPSGTASYNVKYCNDRPRCKIGAEDRRWVALFEKTRPRKSRLAG